LRYGSLYGPRSTRANGVFRLLSEAAATGAVRHIGTADDTREYVHVEDAARLTVEALEETFANSHLTVTGPHPMRLKDLFTMFSEILGRPLDVEYAEPPGGRFDEHYRITPYAFSPKVGRKITSTHYVDMGQGILQLLEQIHRDTDRSAASRGEDGTR
jgi:UDP-glucose 4-epimerase